MKKIIKNILILLTLTIGFMVWAPEVQAKDLVYTALGDSLTDPNTYEGKTWTTYPAYVTNTLSATGNVTLYNHGMGGYKTSDVLNQIKSDEEVINHIKESDIITLQVGANNITAAMLDSLVDAGLISLPFEYYLPEGTNVGACETNAGAVLADKDNGYHANYITSAEADINDIIATIREYNPDARIYIATVYFEQQFFTVLFQGMFALGTTQADYLASEYSISAVELQNYFMDAAAYNDGVYYVDNTSAASVYYLQYAEDGRVCDIHPNQAGQETLATIFVNAINAGESDSKKLVLKSGCTSIIDDIKNRIVASIPKFTFK